MKRISVIVPIHNAENFLPRTLESLRLQSYTALEILMVDDGSTDRSAEICRGYADRDPRFCYLSVAHGGVSHARNVGLERSTGDYIAFCDADDWVTLTAYERMLLLIEEGKADVAVTAFLREGDREWDCRTDEAEKLMTPEEAIFEMHRGELFQGHVWGKLFRASLFSDVRFCEEISVMEDMLAVTELFLRSERIVYLGIPTYCYRVHSQSVLHGQFLPSHDSARSAARQMLALTRTNAPAATAYARRTLIRVSCGTVDRMVRSGLPVPPSLYHEIRREIRENDTAEVRKLFSFRKRFKYRLLIRSLALFRIFVFFQDRRCR